MDQTANQIQRRPRLRFARNQIDRLLRALERIDADEVESGMRLIEAEERIADLEAMIERQRVAIGEQGAIIESLAGGDGRRFTEALRVWVVDA